MPIFHKIENVYSRIRELHSNKAAYQSDKFKNPAKFFISYYHVKTKCAITI